MRTQLLRANINLSLGTQIATLFSTFLKNLLRPPIELSTSDREGSLNDLHSTLGYRDSYPSRNLEEITYDSFTRR